MRREILLVHCWVVQRARMLVVWSAVSSVDRLVVSKAELLVVLLVGGLAATWAVYSERKLVVCLVEKKVETLAASVPKLVGLTVG